MAIVTFGSDPLAEAYALANLLTKFLEDYPQQPPRAAKARFEYEGDALRTVVVTLADPEAGE